MRGPDHPSNSTFSAIVNETVLREAGWTANEAIGSVLPYLDEKATPLTVVGVTKDHHMVSLKEKITPAIFLDGAVDLCDRRRNGDSCGLDITSTQVRTGMQNPVKSLRSG